MKGSNDKGTNEYRKQEKPGAFCDPHWPSTSIGEATEQFAKSLDEMNGHRKNLMVQWWRFFNEFTIMKPWTVTPFVQAVQGHNEQPRKWFLPMWNTKRRRAIDSAWSHFHEAADVHHGVPKLICK